MAKYSIEYATLKGIGNAVREKEGTSVDIPVPELETRIRAITTGVDTSADTVTADVLVEGYTAHDANGNLITGTNPYEKTATNTTVNAQADLIAQIQTALEGKAAGGGFETCQVTLTAPSYGYLDDNLSYTNERGEIKSIITTGDFANGKTLIVAKNTILTYRHSYDLSELNSSGDVLGIGFRTDNMGDAFWVKGDGAIEAIPD